jgi:hypothetical protein
VSPKSRGRKHRPGTRRPARPAGVVRELRPGDRLLRSALLLTDGRSPLAVELWASEWLGQAWAAGEVGRDSSDEELVGEVIERAGGQPSVRAVAALAALRRVVRPELAARLDAALETFGGRLPLPAWAGAAGWTVTRAWRAVDVWVSAVVLLFEVDGPDPFTLIAGVDPMAGARVETIRLARPGRGETWSQEVDPDSPPFTQAERTVPEALAELADAMRLTDMTLPRSDDEGYITHRSLAWGLCREFTPGFADWEPRPDADRAPLLDDFVSEVAGSPEPASVRVIADTCLDFGEGYLPELLAWSPEAVERFLLDYLPRKVVLDATDVAALPAVLRDWLRFCLRRRGVTDPWVEPVLAAVTDCESEFRAAMADGGSWGIGKQLLAGLVEAGVDPTDREALQGAISGYNARRLAERLIDPS